MASNEFTLEWGKAVLGPEADLGLRKSVKNMQQRHAEESTGSGSLVSEVQSFDQ